MSEQEQPTSDEIAEKAAYWTSEVVNARLESSFGDSRGLAALAIAGLIGDDPNDPDASDEASCRLMLDALKVSDGNLMKLRMWVDVAHSDPRDLIAAAEYPLELAGGEDEARAQDFANYIGWLRTGA